MKNGTNLYKKNIPIFTILLAAVNVLVFLYMAVTGDTEDTLFLYNHGGMQVQAVLEDGEWYRVLTHMFIHSGADHLLNNMVMLIAVGYTMENAYGRWKFVFSYFVCGIFATLTSSLYELYTGDFAVGVGASGAIMGIFAIFVAMNIKMRKSLGRDHTNRLLLLIVLMVFGNMQEGVDWMAHLGGAVCGLVLGLLLYRPKWLKTRADDGFQNEFWSA